MKNLDLINEIHFKAEKKHSLLMELEVMNKKLDKIKLNLIQYKGTYIIKGYDEIQQVVDEQIVSTQAMLASPYMKGQQLLPKCILWEKKLMSLSDILDLMKKCQRSWIYLEPIFSLEDSLQTMPKEVKLFKDVNDVWKELMENANRDPQVIYLVQRDNLKETFEKANYKLNEILKEIHQFLNNKRLSFPRFYFLSDDDLLLIISQTKDPVSIQPHLKKCFEGIEKIAFNETNHALSMISSENEKIDFIAPINVNEGDKKGNPEKWLVEVEKSMFETLENLCKNSVKDYLNISRAECIKNWPEQIILTVNQIIRTKETEKVLTENSNQQKQNLIGKINDSIKELINLVRQKLSERQRLIIASLIILEVHSRDISSNLEQNNVTAITDFHWISTMRYYIEKDNKLKIKMVNSVINYGFEYLGNYSILVITPLTDRCYRTLLCAKNRKSVV